MSFGLSASARLPLVGGIGLELESEQEPREAEASVPSLAGDPVAVDLQARVGEAGPGGEPGEGDGETGGCGRDEEVFRAPGGRVGATEDGRRVISIAGLPSTWTATRRSPSQSTVSGKWNSFGRTVGVVVAWVLMQ